MSDTEFLRRIRLGEDSHHPVRRVRGARHRTFRPALTSWPMEISNRTFRDGGTHGRTRVPVRVQCSGYSSRHGNRQIPSAMVTVANPANVPSSDQTSCWPDNDFVIASAA